MARAIRWCAWALIVGTLAACGVAPRAPQIAPAPARSVPEAAPAATRATAPVGTMQQGKARWVPVPWDDLPGFDDDALFEAWNAWLKSCEKPLPPFAVLCPDVRRLSIASAEEQRDWMRQRLRPYRVESLQGEASGLLTGYFEPEFEASRTASAAFGVALYQAPAGLGQRKPWYTRQEIDTLPEAQAALRNRAIAYLADPVDALILQIQGSGRLHIQEADGSSAWVRLAFAASNDQPNVSVGRWLLDRGLTRDASWPGIRAWLAQNPQRQQELLWSNPRVVFFREEALSELDASYGPRGAQGVALTPGRSIAVDPQSIPYGAPVWLASAGAQTTLHRLVLAQDTGSAIVGAVRADYFAGRGPEAADLAGRLKQPLQLWILLPRTDL